MISISLSLKSCVMLMYVIVYLNSPDNLDNLDNPDSSDSPDNPLMDIYIHSYDNPGIGG